MQIGVPKEIKVSEYRVAITPDAVKELTADGHTVFVQKDAGTAIGFPDTHYEEAGATILKTAAEIFEKSDLIVKVKEPQAVERAMLKPHHTLFTYLHLAADKAQAEELLKSGCTAIAYETVADDEGRTPLLAPMSRVAGRLSMIVAPYHLQSHLGGVGLLASGLREAKPAHVLILGAGQAGTSALKSAVGLRCRTTVVDISEDRLQQLKDEYGDAIDTQVSSKEVISEQLKTADIIIGATYVPGAAADKLVTKEMLKIIRPGSVMVDISIDQGGCFETSKPTTHDDPIYTVDGVIHYCVANMPGAVARTSTFALSSNTLSYIKELANKGTKAALAENKQLARGLNVMGGKLTVKPVAEALELPYSPLEDVISASS